MTNAAANLVTCTRCNGSGYVSFRHIENGKCFACGGAGKLTARKARPFVDPHPTQVVPVAERATDAQWNYLVSLCGDNDATFCRFIKAAGGFMATQRYTSRATISKAIDLAKAAR